MGTDSIGCDIIHDTDNDNVRFIRNGFGMRINIKKKFNKYCDGNSCKRSYEKVNRMLKNEKTK